MSELSGFRESIMQYAPLLLQGLAMTIILSLIVMAKSLIAGMFIAILRFYRVPLLARIGDIYVYLLRSIPLIMLIVLVHFGILPLLEIRNSFFLSAFVALSLSTTAYVSEIFRGGFQSLHPEEHEAAKSLGLSRIQRLTYIFVPLVVSRMMPTLINQFVTLIKDTSLASIIGVIELTRAAEIVYERTLHEAGLLILISCIYFGLCYGLSRWSRQLEQGGSRSLEMLYWTRV